LRRSKFFSNSNEIPNTGGKRGSAKSLVRALPEASSKEAPLMMMSLVKVSAGINEKMANQGKMKWKLTSI
jgi:hypothetical protein